MTCVRYLNKSMLLISFLLVAGCQQSAKRSSEALGALDPSSHSNSDVCRFYEFSAKWAREAENRGLDCSLPQADYDSGLTEVDEAAEQEADLVESAPKESVQSEESIAEQLQRKVDDAALATERRIIETMYATATDTDLCLLVERDDAGIRGQAARYQLELRQLDCKPGENLAETSEDRIPPELSVQSIRFIDPRTVDIVVQATDLTGIGNITLNSRMPESKEANTFRWSAFVPRDGLDIQIDAIDGTGLKSSLTERVTRKIVANTVPRLDPVNPNLGPMLPLSNDRVALVIGIEQYANAPPAKYASRDANFFADFAEVKLGIPAQNILLLKDEEASEREILLALKSWLPRMIVPGQTELFVFYAGHGMPTSDGTNAYLVPYDAEVRLLEDTAISRKRFLNEISATSPRFATLFFDNCFSGATRSEELLLASRPLGIKVEQTDVPENYLVFAAGETDQIAGVEPEVKHGRFSYFVFKGLEGEADANSDGKISAGELHQYVKESVGRFSAGAQTPTMVGDAGRWVLK
jgi:hypothetical protein